MERRRIENCMYCGAIVSQKTPQGSLYLDYHVHFYYYHTFGEEKLLTTGTVCLDHFVDITPEVLRDMWIFTRRILPQEKPVNKNFSASVLLYVDDDAFHKFIDYVSQFGTFIPGAITEWTDPEDLL